VAHGKNVRTYAPVSAHLIINHYRLMCKTSSYAGGYLLSLQSSGEIKFLIIRCCECVFYYHNIFLYLPTN